LPAARYLSRLLSMVIYAALARLFGLSIENVIGITCVDLVRVTTDLVVVLLLLSELEDSDLLFARFIRSTVPMQKPTTSKVSNVFVTIIIMQIKLVLSASSTHPLCISLINNLQTNKDRSFMSLGHHPPDCVVRNALVTIISKTLAHLIADYVCDEILTELRPQYKLSRSPIVAFLSTLDGQPTLCSIHSQGILKFQCAEKEVQFQTEIADQLDAYWTCRGSLVFAVYQNYHNKSGYWLQTFCLTTGVASTPVRLIWACHDFLWKVFAMQAHPSQPLVYVLATATSNALRSAYDCLMVLSETGAKLSEVKIPGVMPYIAVNRQGRLFGLSDSDRGLILVMDANTGEILHTGQIETGHKVCAFLGEYNGHMLVAWENEREWQTSTPRVSRISLDRENPSHLTLQSTSLVFPKHARIHRLQVQICTNGMGFAWSALNCPWCFAEIKHH
jgi:hypothetical protein